MLSSIESCSTVKIVTKKQLKEIKGGGIIITDTTIS